MADLQASIEELWERKGELSPADTDAAPWSRRPSTSSTRARPGWPRSTPTPGEVVVHEWLKKAILCSSAAGHGDHRARALRVRRQAPAQARLRRGRGAGGAGASARWGSFLDRGVILMPSYVNIGARVGADTMVDTWATVGSCAQIGARVHLSGGVGIGGRARAAQRRAGGGRRRRLIGSRCMVTQGARVGGGRAGRGDDPEPVHPGHRRRDRRGDQPRGGARLVRGHPASRRREYPGGEFFMPCVLVIKRLTEGERHDKAQLNEVLREHGASA
jgi:2,3,4,5-tetrahydropyridine-2-carboxylate N-succinyltransferase